MTTCDINSSHALTITAWKLCVNNTLRPQLVNCHHYKIINKTLVVTTAITVNCSQSNSKHCRQEQNMSCVALPGIMAGFAVTLCLACLSIRKAFLQMPNATDILPCSALSCGTAAI